MALKEGTICLENPFKLSKAKYIGTWVTVYGKETVRWFLFKSSAQNFTNILWAAYRMGATSASNALMRALGQEPPEVFNVQEKITDSVGTVH